MINVRYLKVFRAVAKAGSVSGAARVLHVSQPAVTKSLRLLEDGLGITLFQRIHGRLFITPEAQMLLPEVERLFGVLGDIKGRADALRDGSYGALTIASVTTLASSLVAQTMARFSVQHPKLYFDVKALPTRLAVQHVATNHVDIGILDAPLDATAMAATPLCRSEVGCLMRKDHPLASRSVITATDLAQVPLITFGEDTFSGMHVRHALHAAGIALWLRGTVNNTQMAYSLVQKGAGIAFVDSFPLLSGMYGDLCIRAFRPLVMTLPSVIFSRSRPVPIVAGLFVEMLQETVRDFIQDERCLLHALDPDYPAKNTAPPQ